MKPSAHFGSTGTETGKTQRAARPCAGWRANLQSLIFSVDFILAEGRAGRGDLGHILWCSRVILALHSGFTPGSAQETIWDDSDQTQVGHVQGRCPTPYTTSPTPTVQPSFTRKEDIWDDSTSYRQRLSIQQSFMRYRWVIKVNLTLAPEFPNLTIDYLKKTLNKLLLILFNFM